MARMAIIHGHSGNTNGNHKIGPLMPMPMPIIAMLMASMAILMATTNGQNVNKHWPLWPILMAIINGN